MATYDKNGFLVLSDEVAAFQQQNCAKGCKFAEKQAIGRRPCCTYAYRIEVDGNECKTRR